MPPDTLLEAMPARHRVSLKPSFYAGLQILAFLWGLLACIPGHALEPNHEHEHATATGLSQTADGPRLHVDASASAHTDDCGADVLATASRREGHHAPGIAVQPGPVGDLAVRLPAGTVRRSEASTFASIRSDQLSRPLRI